MKFSLFLGIMVFISYENDFWCVSLDEWMELGDSHLLDACSLDLEW
jgi:hypothetical protein